MTIRFLSATLPQLKPVQRKHPRLFAWATLLW